jgi:hypothetical protein
MSYADANECAKYLLDLYVHGGVTVPVPNPTDKDDTDKDDQGKHKGLDDLCTSIDKYIVKNAYIRCEESKRTILSELGKALIEEHFVPIAKGQDLVEFLREVLETQTSPSDEEFQDALTNLATEISASKTNAE